MRPACRLGVTIALFCAVPAAAGATDRRLIGSSSEQEIYLDLDNFQSVPGTSTALGYKDVIVTTLYTKPQEVQNVRFQATVSRMLLRCISVEGSLQMLHFYASRDVEGEPIARFDFPTDWQKVDPQTDIGFVWKYVCTHL